MLLRADGELTTSNVDYVDDIHVAGGCKDGEFDHAWAACKQMKSQMNTWGNQIEDDKKYCPHV